MVVVAAECLAGAAAAQNHRNTRRQIDEIKQIVVGLRKIRICRELVLEHVLDGGGRFENPSGLG